MKARRFRSFAKINLGLEVLGRLPGGYHELKTIFLTVGLHDIVTVTPRRMGIEVSTSDPGINDDQTNLAYRAASAMQRLCGTNTGVSVSIEKRIPAGGGLGGGSSNAATVLRALDLMWDAGLGRTRLIETASELGADVPYFLFGGPALGLGRGDVIHPIDLTLKKKVLLVPGGGGVSTAAVFARYAKQPVPKGRRSPIDAFLASPSDTRLKRLVNDLQNAATAESPDLTFLARTVKAAGKNAGALLSLMSGSGSSFFMIFDDADGRRAAAAYLRSRNVASRVCATLSRETFPARFEISD